MQNISLTEIAELKGWLSEFKNRFNQSSDIEHLERIENIFKSLLASEGGKAAFQAPKEKSSETSFGLPTEKPSEMSFALPENKPKNSSGEFNYESYIKEYQRLFEVITATGISLNDPIEFFDFRNVISQANESFAEANGDLKDLVWTTGKELYDKGKTFKDSVYSSSEFSDAMLDRIAAINAIQNLYLDLKAGITGLTNTVDGINHLLTVKFIQACLIDGMKKETELYKKDFFDEEMLFRAEKGIEEAKPFVQKYQKAISMKDRRELLLKTDEQLLRLFCKTLNKTPKQLLEYTNEYNDIING